MNVRLVLASNFAKIKSSSKLNKLDNGSGITFDSFARQLAHESVQDFIDVYFNENLSEDDIKKMIQDLNNV